MLPTYFIIIYINLKKLNILFLLLIYTGILYLYINEKKKN